MTKKQVLGFIPLPTSKPTANPRLNHKISPAINFANPSPAGGRLRRRQQR
jgi:hypothetical protein